MWLLHADLLRGVGSRLALTLFVAGLAAGCGGGSDKYKANRPKTVSVLGKLTYKGSPVGDASVIFSPTEANGVAASSTTDSSGTFLPKAYPPDSGMVPGIYKVVVTKYEQPPAATQAVGGHDAPLVAGGPKSLLPKKYASATTTDVSVTITDKGTDSLAVELKD